ncbi:hypothetical protein BV25DRAFT_1535047 [Artomyces pyxidatus]|uniref:Uncharacterized protein n=1 Tax=Artomyces pyxidatus TaxID=48021 RepID=A0ACB8SKZ1_9AGAM|nr:hypothetical protein BV25DRAFT_1535047 [Artomyces pyxidatus]
MQDPQTLENPRCSHPTHPGTSCACVRKGFRTRKPDGRTSRQAPMPIHRVIRASVARHGPALLAPLRRHPERCHLLHCNPGHPARTAEGVGYFCLPATVLDDAKHVDFRLGVLCDEREPSLQESKRSATMVGWEPKGDGVPGGEVTFGPRVSSWNAWHSYFAMRPTSYRGPCLEISLHARPALVGLNWLLSDTEGCSTQLNKVERGPRPSRPSAPDW